MTPDVSIIIPIYNLESYVSKCIQSIQNQTYKNWEAIIVDDGSTDNSPALCDNFAVDDKRIKVIHQTNHGAAAARNKGIEAASGKWIMFVDADDWLEPDAVECLYHQTQKQCDVVVASYTWDFSDGTSRHASLNVFEEHCYHAIDRREYMLGLCLVSPNDMVNQFPEDMSICPSFAGPWAKLYKKSLLIDNKILFPQHIYLGEDRLFNLYVIYNAQIVVFINKFIYHYFIRNGSTVNSSLAISTTKVVAHLEETYSFIKEHPNLINTLPYFYYSCFKKMEAFSQYLAMEVNLNKNFRFCNKKLISFFKYPICKISVYNLSVRYVKASREKLMLILFKARLLSIALIVCVLYYAIFPAKNRFNTQPNLSTDGVEAEQK
ncbi:glycosyltransferase family 2 protein [Cloacibacillus sp. An23]|uniref:glycosyltransferase n=1 Tax=Cloacibacillus sp. An23 TaxID=1965591 RepID=UPI000B3A2757|nr:glycosyltransferase family 2 protein [Cloacibacillus sp. An23]OUO94594.1 hypothetical protein B5F39_01595 [Cloacibacillus sp. An23]